MPRSDTDMYNAYSSLIGRVMTMSDGYFEEAEPEPAFHMLSPSAKFVYYVLDETGRLTLQQVARETRLPDRTARWALVRLEDDGWVSSEISLADARQDWYTTTDKEIGANGGN